MLDRLLAAKRDEVARLRGGARELARRASAVGPPRDFAAALRATAPGLAVIGEFKRRSPSTGELRAGADPGAAAAAYEAGGAAALSVLTDKRGFGGSLADLGAARDATSLPALRKDFLIDPIQVLESRAAGADAVLLIARILPGPRLAEMLDAARDAGLAALVEVHDARGLERALSAGSEIVGVNARDLATFEVEPEAAREVLHRVPPGVLAVAESGVEGAAGARRAAAAGARAVLVGSWLMRGRDPAARVAELAAVPRGPAVKICGVRRPEDAAAAEAAGADYIGFVLAPSPRRVSAEQAADLARRRQATCVGVFVDPARDEVVAACRAADLGVAQLHGSESPELCAGLRGAGLELWKAIRPRSAGEAAELTVRYARVTDALLVEGWSAAAGGTGTAFPLEWWESIRAASGGTRLILAGGLTPENVEGTVVAARPDAVDVSSGVERRPGEKDVERVRAFVAAARGVKPPAARPGAAAVAKGPAGAVR